MSDLSTTDLLAYFQPSSLRLETGKYDPSVHNVLISTWDCKEPKTIPMSTAHQKLDDDIIRTPRKVQRGWWEAGHSPDNSWMKWSELQPKDLLWGKAQVLQFLSWVWSTAHPLLCCSSKSGHARHFLRCQLKISDFMHEQERQLCVYCIILHHSWIDAK